MNIVAFIDKENIEGEKKCYFTDREIIIKDTYYLVYANAIITTSEIYLPFSRFELYEIKDFNEIIKNIEGAINEEKEKNNNKCWCNMCWLS